MSMYNINMKKYNLIFIKNLLNLFIIFLLIGCASNENIPVNYETLFKTEKNIPQEITLTFTGDLMAHTNVTRMNDFFLIYDTM